METASTVSQRSSDTDTNSQTAGAYGNMKVSFKVLSLLLKIIKKKSTSPSFYTESLITNTAGFVTAKVWEFSPNFQLAWKIGGNWGKNLYNGEIGKNF